MSLSSPVSLLPRQINRRFYRIDVNPVQCVIVGVNNTGEKRIAGVADSGNKHKNANIVKIRNDPNGILKGPGKIDSWKPDVENLVSDSL